MRRWFVYTPEFESGGNPYGDPPEPPEWGADVIEVEAETKRDAIALGVKAMLADRRHYSYCRDQRLDGSPPFAGVKADLAFGESAPHPNDEAGGYWQ